VVGFINFGTSSAFAGTVWKAHDCPAGAQIEHMWRLLVSLPHLSLFTNRIPSLRAVCIFGWALDFTRMVHGLAAALPMHSELYRVHYEVCTDKDRTYKTVYRTVFSHSVNHGQAFMSLAQICGMSLIVSGDLGYADRKAEVYFGNKEYLRSIWHADGQVRMGTIACLTGILCDGYMLNMKVALLTIVCRLRHNAIFDHRLQIVYVSIGLVCCSKQLMGIVGTIRMCDSWYHRIFAITNKADMTAEKNRIREYRNHLSLLKLLFSLFVLEVVHAFLQLSAAFVCEDVLWNISGCLDPDS